MHIFPCPRRAHRMRNKGHERPNSERYAVGSCAADPYPLESNRVGLFGTLRSFRLFNYRNGIYPKKLKLKFSKVRQKARESFLKFVQQRNADFAHGGVCGGRTAQTEKVPPFAQIHRADELRFKAVRKHAPCILGLCAAVQHFEIRRFRLLHGAFPNIKEL